MTDFGMASVIPIVVIVYLIGAIIKASALDDKWIPVICGGSGGVIGLIAFLFFPIADFTATDPISAFAVGIVSGLAAVGLNQAGKQMAKKTSDQ